MKFSWFLALRYLKPKRTFISIITVISVLGVALGVGVLIVVIAVMSGFEKRIKDEWLRVESAVYVKNAGRGWMEKRDDTVDQQTAWKGVMVRLKSFPGVRSVSPYLDLQAMLQLGHKRKLDDHSIPIDPANLPPPPEPPDLTPQPEEAAPPAPAPENAAPEAPPAPAPEAEAAAPEEAPEAEPMEEALSPEEAAALQQQANSAEDATGLDRRFPQAPALIRGVDPDDTEAMSRLTRRFDEMKQRTRKRFGHDEAQASGEFDVSGESIVLSRDLADRIASGSYLVPFESQVNLFGPYYLRESLDLMEENRQAKDDPVKRAQLEAADRQYPMPGDLTLTGEFNDDKMQSIGFVSLDTAQKLAGAGLDIDGFGLDIDDPYDAVTMAEKLMSSGVLPEGWTVETWIDRHRQQFDAVANERGMMYIVLAFISIVAAFCIMNTMITMAVMKRREIGMMRALGAKISHIVGLFMTKGFIVGLMGTGLGYLLGRLVLHYRNELRSLINDRFGHQIFSSEIYGLWEIPAELRSVDQLIICGLAFLLCTLAAVPPAFIVGRMQPAQALRSDR